MAEGRYPIVLVELELDYCSLDFGTSPCDAVVPDGRNNYIIYSQLFSPSVLTQWFGTFLTISNNFTAAPDGTNTAARLLTTIGGGLADLSYLWVVAPYDAPAKFFVWVKRGNRNLERFRIYNATAVSPIINDATWNWTTFSGVNCSVIETAANGWVRLQFNCETNITAGDQIVFNVAFYTGAASNNGDFTYIWGAQACFPAFFSDFRYIGTSGAVVPVNPAISGTGTTECFNTYATCQSRANYAKTTKTYKFSNKRLGVQPDLGGVVQCFPVVTGIAMAPTKLTPREGLGIRASVTVEFTDFVFHDDGIDPYIETRRGGANWEKKSTFARRFLARNANFENRPMRVTTGFTDESGLIDLDSMITRTYLMQNVSWPDNGGKWSITGKDPLRLADSDRATWPARSRIRVKGEYTAIATNIVVVDTEGRLVTALADSQSYLRVGQEILKMTAISPGSSDEYVVTVERAVIPDFYPGPQFNIAAEIKDQAAMVVCHLFEDVDLPTVLFLLLNEGCGIDASYLPIAEWTAAMDAAARGELRLSTLIPEAVSIKQLIAELSELNIDIWWDDRTSKVLIRPILVNPPQIAQWTDRANVLADSLAVAMGSKSRVSQAWAYYGMQWPLADMTKLQSFYCIETFADLEAESSVLFGAVAIQETKTRWLALSQGADVIQMVSNIVLRYRYGKCGVQLMVDPKDRAPWTADAVGIRSNQVVGPNGEPLKVVLSILEAEEQWTDAGMMMRYFGEGQITGLLAPEVREAAITPDTMPDYQAATVAERVANCFICSASGQFADGKPAYTLSG